MVSSINVHHELVNNVICSALIINANEPQNIVFTQFIQFIHTVYTQFIQVIIFMFPFASNSPVVNKKDKYKSTVVHRTYIIVIHKKKLYEKLI